jgi:exopolyphosphatase/guanosine-5'-triphosphate,3'-diphosphate pyrophosphatase
LQIGDFGRDGGSSALAFPIDNHQSPIVNSPTRLAVIDVGTNTVRLLVAEPDGRGAYRTLLAAQETTRLGQGLLPSRELQPAPIRRTVRVLRRYRELAGAQGAATILAVGTSALREAKNRTAFLTAARDEAGVEVAVIPGEDEARLGLLGIRAGLPDAPARLVMMDIGGGSTELLVADGETVLAAVSTGLGVVKLTESCLHTDPPLPEELETVRRKAVERLDRARTDALRGIPLGSIFVGTAGTVTSLAAVDLALVPYDPIRVTGHRMTRVRVAQMLHRLASVPLADRRRVPGLEPARADVIVAGGVICLAAMEVLGFPELTVSDGGLREGILLDLIHRQV